MRRHLLFCQKVGGGGTIAPATSSCPPPSLTPPEVVSGQSKETALVHYLAFLAKVANFYYMILTAFKKYWPDTVAKFTSGTQETFI